MKKLEDIIHHNFTDKKRRALVNLFFTSNFIQGKVAEALRPLDMTFEQFNVLSIVNGQEKGRCTVGTIKERMFDRMSNVSRLLNKLVAKGWIEKKRCTNDQRVVYVQITESGVNMRNEGRTIIDAVNKKCETLTVEESNQLNDLIEKLRKNYF
ncbi:MAG: MarR family transcriptional regulator [Fibrobacterales bacterium]